MELLGKGLLIISDIKSSPTTQAVFTGSLLIKPRVDFFHPHPVESCTFIRQSLNTSFLLYLILVFIFLPFQFIFFSFLSFIFSSLFPVLLFPSSASIETAWFLLKTNNDNIWFLTAGKAKGTTHGGKGCWDVPCYI